MTEDKNVSNAVVRTLTMQSTQETRIKAECIVMTALADTRQVGCTKAKVIEHAEDKLREIVLSKRSPKTCAIVLCGRSRALHRSIGQGSAAHIQVMVFLYDAITFIVCSAFSSLGSGWETINA